MEESIQIEKSRGEISNVNIKDLFYKYVRFLPVFVLSLALSLFAAYTYLRYSTPIYESTGSLIIRDEKKQGGDKLDQLISSGAEVNIQNEIEQLRSRPIMERVVESLNLNLTYLAKGKVKASNIYKSAPFRVDILSIADSSAGFTLQLHFPDANSFRMNEESRLYTFGQTIKINNNLFRLIKTEGVIGDDYVVHWQPTTTVAAQISSDLVVYPKPGTKILILTMQATNPLLAKDAINRLMNEYRLNSVKEKNETINQQLDFINDRIAIVDRELDDINNNLLAFQRANNIIDIESQSSSYMTRIEESDRLLTEQRAQMEVIQMIDTYLRNRKNDFNTTPSTLGIPDPTLSTLIAAYNVAQLERKDLLDRNIPRENPLVEAKESQIEKLRQNILENIGNIKVSYQSTIKDLERTNSIAETQIRLLPEKEQRLVEIRRQQETKLAVYNILLEERERSSITLAATTANVRVVDEANLNLYPIKPSKRSVQLIAIFIGLLIPALAIFVKELLNDKVNSRVEIERFTDVTILGEVGHSYGKEALVVASASRSMVAEQFRIIRSNLQYVIANIPKPVILVTSSFSGEGKSFISTNMGAVLALAGKRTIILEFDIRKPKVLSHLNLPKRPGLTNYLLGKSKLEELPIPVPGYDNLFVLACGPVPPNPAEILLDSKIEEVFAFLHEQYDIIVMDTAPVGMVSDALTLSRFANTSLFIVRQGYTYKKQIGLINAFSDQGKLPRLNIIVNDVKNTAGYGYYGYGQYGYGSGYFEDENVPKPGFMHTWLGWIGLNGKNKKKKSRKETI